LTLTLSDYTVEEIRTIAILQRHYNDPNPYLRRLARQKLREFLENVHAEKRLPYRLQDG
jgi:hypothetical protein